MSQQNSPKFDPNQPYETVDSAPKFNPDAPFEVIGETVKKKEEPVSFGGGESVASPSVVTEDKTQEPINVAPIESTAHSRLSFSEQQQTKTPDFMGLFNKKEQISKGVNLSQLKAVGEAAKNAEYPAEFIYKSDQVQKRLDALKKYFPELSTQADEIKKQNINPSNVGDFELAISELEKQSGANPTTISYALNNQQVASSLTGKDKAYYDYYKSSVDTEANAVVNTLTVDNDRLNKAKEAISRSGVSGSVENVFTGLWGGFKDYFKDYIEVRERIKSNPKVQELTKKLEDGNTESLTTEDRVLAKMVLDNYGLRKSIEDEIPSSYKIGRGTGESGGFMLEFILTGGLGGGAASKIISKGVAKAVAEGVAVSTAKKIGIGTVAKLADSGIQTAWMPSLWKGTAEDVSKGEGFAESLAKNYYKTFAETFTEKLFLKNPWNKGAVGAVDGVIQRMGINMNADKGAVGVLWNQLEESAEEKISELMTAPIDYNNFKDFWSDYWDLKKNAEMFGTVALMVAPAGIVSESARAYDNVKLNRIGKLLPSGIRSELDVVLNDKKLTLKEQYNLIGKIVEDNVTNKTLGAKPAEAAGNIIQYTQQKTKQNVVSAVEDRKEQGIPEEKVPTVGEMEPIADEQQKLDYLKSKDVKVPDGTTMEQLDVLYNETKQKEEPKAPVISDKIKPNETILMVSADAKTALERGRKKQVISVDEQGNPIVEEIDFTQEDAELELDRLEALAKKGRLTPEQFQSSYFGQTDGNTLKAASEEIKKDQVSFVAKLKESFLQPTKKQEPVVVEETKQVEIKPTEPISTAVEEVIPKEAPIVPIETKEGYMAPKPSKSIEQMSSEEIRSFSDEIKQHEKNIYSVVFGEQADRFRQLERSSNNPTKSGEQLDEIGAEMDKMINELPKEKRDVWDSEAEYDATELRDMSRMVGLVEESENINELSSSLKNPLMTFSKNKNNKQTLAIFNAAIKKAQELGVSTEELIGQTSKLIAKEFKDPQDAIDVVKSALEAISQPTVVEQKQLQPKQQKQPIVGEQIEVKQVKKEEDEKGNKSGGEKTSQGRKEKLLVESRAKLEREVKKEENKARLGRIFDNAAILTRTRLDITGEERKKIRKELSRDVVDYVRTEFDLLGEALVEKVKSFVKDNNIPLEDVSDQELNDVLKEKGYAGKIRESNQGDLGTQKGVVEGTEGKVSVGDNGKDKKTPQGQDEGLKAKTQKLSTTGKDIIKVGRFETRLTLDDTKLPQSVKDQIKERGIGEFVSMTDEQSYAIARQIAESTPIEEITQMSLSQDVHPMVRVGLMLEANKIFNKEVMLAEKEGRIADAQKWSDQQIDYYEEYAQINSRNAALLLRGLGTAAAFETFAPFTHVVKYKRDTAAERQKLQSTDTHKKSVKKVQKVAKTAYNDAVEGAINDPKVQRTIKDNEGKPTTPVKPDRLVELKKKEKSLIEKLKKSFGGTLTSGGLTKEGIEALGELAVVYIEEAGYHVGNAVKKLIKTAKAVGFTLTQEEALKYMPKEIEGKPIKEKQAEEETQKAAEKLATKIFGEVVVTKPKQDPLLQMVNTLLGKFKERDLGKERKKPTTDLEKIADAIQNKETYSEVWIEARDMAVAKVEENELLDDVQKKEATARIEGAYKKATSFTFTEAQVDRAIKRKMAELNVRVSDIVKEFYDIQSAERGKLSDALIEEAGLSKEQANVLAEAIERRFDTILSEGKKKIVEKYIGKIKDGNTGAEKAQSKQRKTKTAELLELINVGAFESPEFREAYATAVGIPDFNQANANIIRKLGEEIQRQKEPLQKHKKIQDLLGFIKLLGGISPSDMALSIWYANTLSGIKTQERNIVGGTSGVTLRLLSDALVSGRPMATARGYINGITSGWTKAMDAWKEGYAPFSSRVEIPSTAEVYQMKRGLFKPIWNSIKYVGRTMNALDLLNAETGKEAFATVLANEALKVNRWKALVSPSYAKEQRELVKKYLVTDKETVARLRKEIEDDAVEFGYTELDKRMILLDKINRMRPTETTEQAARFGVYSTGNVESFGTVGFLSDKIGDALKGIKLTYSEPKTGKQKTIAPLSLFAAFTKIAGNVGEMSLNYVPSVGMYRVYRGAYGSGFRMDAAKGATPNSKYAVELTPREKQTIIGQQILGTVAMVGLYLLTQPDDEDKSTIRITANGTGDFRANKNLTDWQEYSIGVTTEDGKTTWISYKNTPLILPFSVLGFMRDSKKYKKEFKEIDDLDLFTKGIQGMPSFLGDMSAIGSMTKVFDNLINVGSGKSTQSIPDNLLNTVKNFYTPALYRDVVDLTEQMWDVNVEAKIKGTSFFDLEAKKQQMFGRNPISVIKKIINKNEVVEAIDVYGRPTERLMPLDIIIKRDSDPTESDKLALYHQRYANVPVEPNASQTLFEAFDLKSQEYVKILLDQGDKRQQQLWHNFVKRRGELILQAISENMDLQGEEYRDAIEPAIRDASQQARLEIEEELTVNPLKDIEERQLKKQ